MPLLRCLPLEMHSSWRMKFLYLPTVCRSELVADLGFVTVLIFVVTAAEEDAAVEVLAVGDAFELEDEVLVLADGLQITRTILDIDGSIDDGELRFLAGKLLPASEVLAI